MKCCMSLTRWILQASKCRRKERERERERERDGVGWGGKGWGAKACRQTDRRGANELHANHSGLPATVFFVLYFFRKSK